MEEGEIFVYKFRRIPHPPAELAADLLPYAVHYTVQSMMQPRRMMNPITSPLNICPEACSL
jgi:hypothetical protein